jgi:hypothetical protein
MYIQYKLTFFQWPYGFMFVAHGTLLNKGQIKK